MSTDRVATDDALSLAAEEEIDRICLRFEATWKEATWKSGTAPRIEEYVEGADPSLRAALLQELVGLDVDYRSRRGDAPSLDDYCTRFPEDTAVLQSVFSRHTAASERAQATIAPGTQFGDYELIEEIARGGMGVVYKAQQRGLNRIVALKMILAGHLASEREVERFRREAEAAAKLQHPNIVSIHEVGCHDGQHFFSMDFVPGESLRAIIRGSKLSALQAADCVRIVADAIQYAHGQGIIHRDIKPANVLIDEQGQPRVTDFGLAKPIEDDSDLTGSGQLLGTPNYIPPEQASGQWSKVGPASDVYSLGAVLYELITGRPPSQAVTLADTLKQVTETEPVPPRQIDPAIPRDLATICQKCLQKEPAQRYMTASALAGDLGRLQNRPILARPTTHVARLRRWTKRNPVAATMLTAIVLLLCTLTTVLYAAYARTSRALTEKSDALTAADESLVQKEAALEEKDAAIAERGEAIAELTKIQQWHGEQIQRYSALLLDKEVFQLSGRQELRERLQAELGDYLAEFSEIDSSDPDVNYEQGIASVRLAKITADEGSIQAAIGQAKRAAASLKRLHKNHPDNLVYKSGYGAALSALADFHFSARDFARAEECYQEASRVFSQLAAAEPDWPKFRVCVAEMLTGTANVHLRTGRVVEAEKSYLEAVEMMRRLVGDYPDEPTYSLSLATACSRFGGVYTAMRRYDKAEKVYKEVLDTLDNLSQEEVVDTRLMERLEATHYSLARLYEGTMRYSLAKAHLETAIPLCERLVELFPEAHARRHELAVRYKLLAMTIRDVRYREAADAAIEKASQIWEQLARGYPDVPTYQYHLAQLYCVRGLAHSRRREYEAEREYYERSLPEWRGLVKALPEIREYRRHLDATELVLLLSAADTGSERLSLPEMAAKARETTKRLEATNQAELLMLYYRAARLAAGRAGEVGDGAVGDGAETDDPSRRALAEQFAGVAMAALEVMWRTGGFRRGARLMNDPALKPLRDREDFRALAARVAGDAKIDPPRRPEAAPPEAVAPGPVE